jgi:hypothetical protein
MAGITLRTPVKNPRLVGRWRLRLVGISGRQNDAAISPQLIGHSHSASAELLDDAVVGTRAADKWR